MYRCRLREERSKVSNSRRCACVDRKVRCSSCCRGGDGSAESSCVGYEDQTCGRRRSMVNERFVMYNADNDWTFGRKAGQRRGQVACDKSDSTRECHVQQYDSFHAEGRVLEAGCSKRCAKSKELCICWCGRSP